MTEPNKPLPARMTIAEIAATLDIGTHLVYRALEDGQIPGLRIGKNGRHQRGTWMVTRYAFQRWLETCGLPNTAAKGEIK